MTGAARSWPPFRPRLVRCAGCGYLSRKIDTPELAWESQDKKQRDYKFEWEYDEIPRYWRGARSEELGELYFGKHPYRDFPLEQTVTVACFRRAYNLEGEFAVEQIAPLERIDRYVKIIHKERPCPFWFPHSAGLTPLGHQQLQEKQEEAAKSRWVSLIGVIVGGLLSLLAAAVTILLTR
ncbi:MAG: hypothetical protein MUP14_02370 [Dehalococcoidia bacterium]|nr:hypothetical protein [Dehalococcoidia bacterium]